MYKECKVPEWLKIFVFAILIEMKLYNQLKLNLIIVSHDQLAESVTTKRWPTLSKIAAWQCYFSEYFISEAYKFVHAYCYSFTNYTFYYNYYFFQKYLLLALSLLGFACPLLWQACQILPIYPYDTKKYNFKLWYAATIGLSKQSDIAYFSSFLDCKKVVQWLRYGIDFEQFIK